MFVAADTVSNVGLSLAVFSGSWAAAAIDEAMRLNRGYLREVQCLVSGNFFGNVDGCLLHWVRVSTGRVGLQRGGCASVGRDVRGRVGRHGGGVYFWNRQPTSLHAALPARSVDGERAVRLTARNTQGVLDGQLCAGRHTPATVTGVHRDCASLITAAGGPGVITSSVF